MHVVFSLNPGGTERLVIEMTKRMFGEAVVVVCCLDELGDWASEPTDEGIAVDGMDR